MKKQLGAVAVLSMVLFGTVASAERTAAPKQKTASPATPTETFTLRQGETKTLEAPDAVRVSIGDPSIVRVLMDEGAAALSFRVTGEKEGQTTVTVWPKSGPARTYAILVVKK
jgi:Flp pilus assembly secretin CpaC